MRNIPQRSTLYLEHFRALFSSQRPIHSIGTFSTSLFSQNRIASKSAFSKNHHMTQAHPDILAPSILAANHGKLLEGAQLVEKLGLRWLHVDIMDGHFVPNLTFGPDLVAALDQATDLFLDV